MASTNFNYMVSSPDGNDRGPFNLQQMKGLIATGEVVGATFVKRSDATHWSTAAEYAELKVRDVIEAGEKSAMQLASEEMGNAILARTVRRTGVWFLWIGIWSMINAVMAYMGSPRRRPLGLELSTWLAEVAQGMNAAGSLTLFIVNAVIACVFLGFGFAAWSARHYLPFLIGMSLYAGDLVLSAVAQNIPGIILHCFALFWLYRGHSAFLEITERPAGRSLVIGVPTALATAAVGLALVFAFPPRKASGMINQWTGGAKGTPEAWSQKPPAEWPQMLLTHDAEFKGHGTLEGASSFLMTLPDGKLVAVTAAHLFGFQSDLPKMSVKDIDGTLVSWKMHARGKPDPFVKVTGLLGDPRRYTTYDDVIALKVDAGTNASVFQPLKFRSTPVRPGEKVFIVGVPYDDPSAQLVYPATITAADDRLLDGYVEKKVAMEGFSGAPVVDANGWVIGVLTGPAGLFNPEKDRGFSAHAIVELEDVLATLEAAK